MPQDESPLVRDDSPDIGYTSVHRALLQAFLTYNVMTVDEMKPVLAHIITASSKLPHSPLSYAHTPQTQTARSWKAT